MDTESNSTVQSPAHGNAVLVNERLTVDGSNTEVQIVYSSHTKVGRKFQEVVLKLTEKVDCTKAGRDLAQNDITTNEDRLNFAALEAEVPFP